MTLGSSKPDRLAAWQAGHPGIGAGSFSDAAAHGELLKLAVLWCIPGLRNGQWAHAFKLLKPAA